MSTMLLPKDYQMALLSQGAINLSGLAHSLAEVLPRIWEEARAQGQGTDWVNGHAIVRLYVEQMMHLAQGRDYSDAYAFCAKHAERPPESAPPENAKSPAKPSGAMGVAQRVILVKSQEFRRGSG